MPASRYSRGSPRRSCGTATRQLCPSRAPSFCADDPQRRGRRQGQPALRGWDSCQPNGPGRGLDALGRRSRHCHALVLARHSLVGRARSRSRLAAHGRRRPCCWMSLHTRGWPTRAVDLGEAVRAGHLRGSERVQPASARRDGSACRGWRDHVGSSRGSACGADGRDSVHQVRAFIAQRALPYLAVGRSFCS
jgi:hypothetical protein